MNDPPPATYLELEGRLLGNTGWVALGHGGRQVVSFLVILVLARLLDPEDFGLVALAWVVLAFAEQIQETGIGQALIHRRHDVGRAAASALVFSSSVSLLLYGAVFAAAPLFARFLHAPDLVDVLRVMALVLVFRGLGVVPGAILERDLDFRSRTIAELAATIANVSVCLGLAFAGAGVWSLVFGHLALGAVQTTLYWFLVPWRPSLRSANSRTLRELMRFGRFIGAVNVLTIVSNTVDDVVVGRVLGTPSVGVYSVVFRLANFPNVVLGHIVGRPMFSIYSMLQHDPASFRLAYVRNLQRVALVSVPVSVGLAIAAEPIVATLFGDKWLSGVPALRILAVYGLVKTFGAVSAEALKAIGASHLVLMFGVAYVVVAIPALIVLTRQFDLAGAALSMLLAVGASAIPMTALTARRVRLGVGDFARALTPALFCSALLAATLAALLVPAQSMPPAASLAVLVLAGLCVYIAATGLFARSTVLPMWSSLRGGGRNQ
jgi:PST family polysaccharide transporter